MHHTAIPEASPLPPLRPKRRCALERKKGGPIPRKGRPNRTNHYENQAGALHLAAHLKQFNNYCHYGDGNRRHSIQSPVENRTGNLSPANDCGGLAVC